MLSGLEAGIYISISTYSFILYIVIPRPLIRSGFNIVLISTSSSSTSSHDLSARVTPYPILI